MEVTPEDGEFTPEEPEEVNLGKGVEAENGMRIATPEEVSAGVTGSDLRLMEIPKFTYRPVQENLCVISASIHHSGLTWKR